MYKPILYTDSCMYFPNRYCMLDFVNIFQSTELNKVLRIIYMMCTVVSYISATSRY